ncbi:transcription factor SPT20 homolog [Metopolophium dirhodum]|uniref:transcription factor SPT20 homolog n=1 Tax=Metopolophium dirhodum TaxID=44670 RepID=UPI00298FC709|nr:transcription factor SPT20 homolog [Metopolophium dirhodum]
MCSHHRSKDSQRSSKFTAHAAVQLQRRHNNSTSRRYDEGQLLEDLGHKESVQLERLVHETFPRCNVDLIHVVNDPQMYGMYLLRKEEMRHGDKERILYHVTTMSRALESLKSGLDWRRTGCSKLFGCGVLFSDDADYANYYADHSPKEESRVIIVCAVLVNKTQRESGNQNLIVLSGNSDTTVSSNGRAYVKYNDYDFYPMYLMYYRRTLEHLNESKYFRNDPHDKWRQNTRVKHQQQQQQKKQQELKAQREREQAQRQQERKQVQRQQELRAQREKQQAQRQQELRAQRGQQQAQRQQERQQAQCQQDLRAQQEREQEQRQQELRAQKEREQEQRQQELRAQREKQQAQRQQERQQAQCQQDLRAQKEREQEQRQQELRAQREKQQAQRQQERQQAQCQQDLRAQQE